MQILTNLMNIRGLPAIPRLSPFPCKTGVFKKVADILIKAQNTILLINVPQKIEQLSTYCNLCRISMQQCVYKKVQIRIPLNYGIKSNVNVESD